MNPNETNHHDFLWQQVKDNNEIVYFVVEEGDFPFVQPPETLDPEDRPEDYNPLNEQAYLMVFTTKEGADFHRSYHIEMQDLAESKCKVVSMSLKDLWTLLDELVQISHDEWGVHFEVILAHSIEEQGSRSVTEDRLFSSLSEPN